MSAEEEQDKTIQLLRDECDSIRTVLSNIKNTEDVNENEITNSVSKLRRQIRVWVESQTFLTTPSLQPGIDMSKYKHIEEVIPNYRKFVGTDQAFHDCVVALIWKELVNNIFKGNRCEHVEVKAQNLYGVSEFIEMGKLYDDFKSSTAVKPLSAREVEDIHRWRWLTARILMRFNLLNVPKLGSFESQNITRSLSAFAKDHRISGLNILSDILRDAFSLNLKMVRQSKFWRFEMWENETMGVLPYDTEIMDDRRGRPDDQNRVVTLVVEPGLSVWGDNDSRNYHDGKQILAARVRTESSGNR